MFSNGMTPKYGDLIEDNVVHLDVFSLEDIHTTIGEKIFFHIKDLQPLPIDNTFLDKLGFESKNVTGKEVYGFHNAYFENLISFSGHFTVRRVDNNQPYGVQYIHDLQRFTCI